MSRTLLEQWQSIAYNEKANKGELQRFWGSYFQIEKEIYEQLLDNPEEEVTGTVKELAQKYGQEVLTMVGFLDGINDSLKEPNPIETMDEDTEVSLAFDKEKLYKNMVAAKADWLYELPQWKEIYSEEELKKMYKEQKESGTIRKEKKIGRNDPCPCGSGKKYKKCCGR
ncbi:MAG TPA: SEC-C domain-containing protein [Candidatus Dorea gallistercoris]|uniref:SEC-C domain-containing protein n=1 Tax=Candidatus Dorea gallistercoris TaxID=2838542 RepID=A0A9D1UEG9_9FIRM|nr:SEC-C domain-containing protein [Candidatus Dorea gallistercoris]